MADETEQGDEVPTDVTAPDLAEVVKALKKPPARREVDPEDWASAGSSDDERYRRERPPHWE